MRRALLVLVAMALVAGCAERREPGAASPSPAETSPAAQEEPTLPDSTCEASNEGDPANLPDFTGVELESTGGVDRITFQFEPQPDAPDKPPWYYVSFADELVTEGEGRPVEVEGEAFLVVSFQAIGTDLSGETPVPVYTGDERFTPGFGTLREAVMLGDFEAQVSWGLGLARRACYRIDAGADHLTVELPTT